MERNQGHRPDGKSDSSEEILGRYTLLTQIAEGELATVHLARQHGDSGFQRLVAIKRLKPLLARKPECVQLLLDEARLTSDLHHANLIGCLDMGTEGGCYVVQNYVEGDSLQGLLKAAGAETHARYVVPLIVDVLNGLHAVHTALDAEGVPLKLVHQAPRARHVLVGIDGMARLCDFTQARACGLAVTRQRNDRMKIANMAPEQALNPEGIDHRADLFLVGVMLWEALTGARLFAAESDELTFQQLLHRRIPRPSEVGFRPPRCFDAICLRALERDPDKRYRSSLEMARELRDTALNHALYATTGEIGQWVKGLAGTALIERRRFTGSDTASHGVPSGGASASSGFFQAAKTTDLYGSGLIFGGSFSRLDPSAPLDPDRTPALGNRLSSALPRDDQAPEPYAMVSGERDDEPTAKVTTSAQRERKITAPYGSLQPVVGRDSAGANAFGAGDDEPTRPTALAPSKPVAQRAQGAASPGAYSQVLVDRKSKPAAAQPSPPVAAPKGASAGAAKPRSRAAVDAPSTADHRTDSTPTRLRVPSTPVGSPYRDASPGKAPATFELPPMPRALGELSGRTRSADVLRVPVDSLSPPNSASRTVPPAPPAHPAPRSSRAIWLLTGVLAAIILLAVGVSMRRMGVEPKRVTAGQPSAPVPEPARIPAPAQTTETLEQAAQPSPGQLNEGPTGAAPDADPIGAIPEPEVEAALNGTTPPAPAAATPRLGRPAATKAPARKPATEVALPEVELEEPPAKPARPRGKGPFPIPDNPY